MSWFDSSFGLAKTALSQAQKSIDRVLDIQEVEGNSGSINNDDSTGTHMRKGEESVTGLDQSNDSSVSDSFSSTWGGMDSIWGTKPTKTDQQVKTTPLTKKPSESTPTRKPQTKLSTAKPKNPPANKTTPTSSLTTPTGAKQVVKATTPPNNDPPTPINPQTVKENTNMTSTPISAPPTSSTPIFVTPTSTTHLPDTPTPTRPVSNDLIDGREGQSDSVTTDPPVVKTEVTEISEKEKVDGEEQIGNTNIGIIHISLDRIGLRKNNGPKRERAGSDVYEQQGLAMPTKDSKPTTDTQVPKDESERDNEEVPTSKDEQAPTTTVHDSHKQLRREEEGELELCHVHVHQQGFVLPKESNSTTDTQSPGERDNMEVELIVPSSKEEQLKDLPIQNGHKQLPIHEGCVVTSEGCVVTGEGQSNGSDEEPIVSSKHHQHIPVLETELRRVQGLLDVRESKVLQQSEELINLQQTNQEMQRCLDEFKRQIEKLDDSKDSQSQRLTMAEGKVQTLTTERNNLRKQLQALNDERGNDSTEKRLTDMLKEKEEMIAGLMEEGEKLSRQELQSNNVIKKLRSREKLNENTISTIKQQLEDTASEVRKLKDVIKKKEENEQKYQETLGQMNSMVEQQAKELIQIKPEREELHDRARSLQTNLDNAYKELTELRKSNALSQSAVEEATVSAQQVAKDELKRELEEQRLKGEREKDALMLQINELRLSVSRTDQQSTWREEQLRQEIADLHKRIQESEGRNQDLYDTISDATRPLLRQIEHLRSAHSAQSTNWEKVESSLTQRLVEAQTQLNSASEKERSATEKFLTFQSRLGSLEEQLTSVRQERSQLVASLEAERTKLSTLEETHRRETKRHETYRLNVQQNVEELKKDKEMLERQLEYERVRLEAESRKADLESQEKEKLRNQLAMSLTSLPLPSVSRQSSSSTSDSFSTHEHHHPLSSTSDLNSILRLTGVGSYSSATALEHLQTLLKQREGELANSQDMVSSLERSRTAITEELTQLAASNEALKREVETIPGIRQQLLDITKKYEALLQMFGEKVEEAEELRLDIQDLKSMYRQQIEELVTKR